MAYMNTIDQTDDLIDFSSDMDTLQSDRPDDVMWATDDSIGRGTQAGGFVDLLSSSPPTRPATLASLDSEALEIADREGGIPRATTNSIKNDSTRLPHTAYDRLPVKSSSQTHLATLSSHDTPNRSPESYKASQITSRQVSAPALPALSNVELLGRHPTTDIALTAQLASTLRTILPPLFRISRRWDLAFSLDQNGSSLRTLYDSLERWDSREASDTSRQVAFLFVLKSQASDICGAFTKAPLCRRHRHPSEPSSKASFLHQNASNARNKQHLYSGDADT